MTPHSRTSGYLSTKDFQTGHNLSVASVGSRHYFRCLTIRRSYVLNRNEVSNPLAIIRLLTDHEFDSFVLSVVLFPSRVSRLIVFTIANALRYRSLSIARSRERYGAASCFTTTDISLSKALAYRVITRINDRRLVIRADEIPTITSRPVSRDPSDIEIASVDRLESTPVV